MAAQNEIEAVVLNLLKGELDINGLDNLVAAAYDPVSPHRAEANKALMGLQESPELWQLADGIIEKSQNPQARFFGLQILDDAIKSRWKILPPEQKDGIKNYVVGKIIAMSSDEAIMNGEKVFIGKLNLTLVEILKQEWPHNWPSFISDLVGSSKSSEVLCENNMQILKLLSEEVFDFSRDQMVTEKVKRMKESLNGEFAQIFELLDQFRNDALDCLTEIGTLQDLDPQYDPLFRQLFTGFLQRLGEVFSPETDLRSPFKYGTEDICLFIQKLALFLSGFFKAHLKALEVPESQDALIAGMFYLVRVSEVQDTEIFRICLEAWHMLAEDLYKSDHGSGASYYDASSTSRILNLNGNSAGNSSRKFVYSPVLTGVRQVMIANMAKPEEVLIVEDENGDIVRETTKDTDVIAQYKTMRDTLVYLTHLNCEDTDISGAMSEDEEKRFLVTVIKDLLGLCEATRGKDNKAVVASNIMYVVGQYPRFLRAHWKFLKTVVNKLFEFMHESHPGVQDMACDTFLKVSTKCKRKFVTVQSDETRPFIMELIESLPSIISDLEPHQVQAFYEAVGCMLNDKGPSLTINRQELQAKLMEMPNRTWRVIMDQAQNNVENLVDPATIKEIVKILKTNNRVCRSVGGLFTYQLQTFFLDMLNVYRVYSERISAAVAQQGAIATQMSLVRTMRSAKKEVLRLLIVFIDKSGPPEAEPIAVAKGFIPPVLDPILGDYQRNIAGARDPEVLTLFSTVVEKLKGNVVDEVPRVMEAIFECTLEMISKNFEDFPEHRIRFFEFLKAVNQHCFSALFNIPPEHQKLVVHAIVWAMKHTERNISDTGLEILHDLLMNVGK
ncbi:CRM1 C terminal-domain containing protein [Nitzschia inconspicua]|uniref:CRM1 C terminal-domain containing protein n=1 Tax=Nitzschia inconspicua TaxID=303405 RepID=A0A9K3K5W9_9STRA|nr:CRM1 C terminal-domain containing protein [Nitzschia inconspicua]